MPALLLAAPAVGARLPHRTQACWPSPQLPGRNPHRRSSSSPFPKPEPSSLQLSPWPPNPNNADAAIRRRPAAPPQPARDRAIDFGKYKGSMLGTLPVGYLNWISTYLRDDKWALLADEVLADPVYQDRIEWDQLLKYLSGDHLLHPRRRFVQSGGGADSGYDKFVALSKQFGWDFADKKAWDKVKLDLVGTSFSGRIPRRRPPTEEEEEEDEETTASPEKEIVAARSKREERRERTRMKRKEHQEKRMKEDVTIAGSSSRIEASPEKEMPPPPPPPPELHLPVKFPGRRSMLDGVNNPFPGRGALLDRVNKRNGS